MLGNFARSQKKRMDQGTNKNSTNNVEETETNTGHIAPMKDDRWSKRIIWRLRADIKWVDDIRQLVGNDWIRIAQDLV